MRACHQVLFRQQLRFLKRQLLRNCDLPFSDVLSTHVVSQAITAIEMCWLDRVYSPVVTLWVFLGQLLHALSRLGNPITLARLCQKAVRATWFLRQRETDRLMLQRVRHHDRDDSTG